MENLYTNVPCRENQLNDLLNLLGDSDEPLPYSLFISGSMATGKTMCIDGVLKYLGYKHVTVDCIECYSPKLMYESILSELGCDFDAKCDTMLDLTNALNRIGNNVTQYEPMVIVFDRAERMRSMDQSVMCAFLRLRELCNLNICTIFISHLIYDNFYFRMGVREPIKIYFPNYNKEELFKIIFLHHKSFVRHVIKHDIDIKIKDELEKPELFAKFLNAFLSVFYRPCRDLIELQHMARVNFVKYCEPIIKTEIQVQDLSKLWRHISPILKASLELLYLRISTSKSTKPSPGKENSSAYEMQTYNFENTLKDELTSTKTFAQSFELPYYAKFLLIAAYLASYNPPKEDKRLFMKNHGRQRKRLQQVKSKAKISEKLNTQLGPKVFTLDRLLAIFYAILEEKIGLTSNLLAQIATLVELKLIAGSKETDLDISKYKCIVGYDFITAVAQTVGFNVRKHLYDFM
ncbi:origin recognition complex subunit 5 [Aphomia sociella]